MRYDFVEVHRGRWPVRAMCRVPHVSPGGYYDWRGRPQRTNAQRLEALIVSIKAIHGEVKARYGSPRVHAELIEPRCVKTVARLMPREGSAARTRRKSRRSTDPNPDRPVAENVVSRDFKPTAADRTWTADITDLATGEGWLDLAAVDDWDSEQTAGWSMGPRVGSRPVVDALAARQPGAGLVAHSDRAGQYAGEHYQGLLARHGIARGISRGANCQNNAPLESFFAGLEKESTHGETFARRSTLLEDIEAFCNRIPRHLSLGYLSPSE